MGWDGMGPAAPTALRGNLYLSYPIHRWPLDAGRTDERLHSSVTFDVARSECTDEDDHQRLLGVIEASFGMVAGSNPRPD